MKKILLLALLNFVVVSAFSASVGAKWRWRNNDGNEKTATWKAAQNTPISITNDQTLRFRAQFKAADTLEAILRYGNDPRFADIVINDDPNTTNAFYLVKNTTTVTHLEATTRQLVPNSDTQNPTFRPGIVITKTNAIKFSPEGDGITEFEWCIKPTRYAKPGGIYYFSTNPGVTNWNQTGAENPYLLTHPDYAVISPDSITNYSINRNGRDIYMTWNTALQGHDHFEIEGRLDTSATFKHLATVPGGNARSYQTILKDAPRGLFHYRIKLFDKNQVMSISRTVKFNNESADVLLGFSLHPSPGSIHIKWKTALHNHSRFIIQKSYSADKFTDVDTIPGGIGQNFSTTLPFNEQGTVYLRMKLYDGDNRETISPTKTFVLNSHVELVKFEGAYNSTNGTMQLNFSTSSEYFNGKGIGFRIIKYEFQPYQQVETTVAQIKGQAWVQNKITNYTAYDNNVDRRYETRYYLSCISDERLVERDIILPALPGAALTFNIYPNPVNSDKVSFDLKGYQGKTLTATLTNLYGKQISTQTFSTSTNENYILKTNTTSGTYVLNVAGEGISKTGKVLIQ